MTLLEHRFFYALKCYWKSDFGCAGVSIYGGGSGHMRNSFHTRISQLADQYNPKEVVQRELLLLTHFLAKLTVTKEARTSSTSEQ